MEEGKWDFVNLEIIIEEIIVENLGICEFGVKEVFDELFFWVDEIM